MVEFDDGLDVLRSVMSLEEIASLIEKTARWVDPETFKLLPLWFPEYGRRSSYYKANWSAPQMNKNRQTGQSTHKVEGNRYANTALTSALGIKSKMRPNWSCCHVWGVDDPSFQRSNVVVSDHRFFSCVANMVLLPTPLKAFTDALPDLKTMLRICARNLYGWQCDHDALADEIAAIDQWENWGAYPKSWPRQPNERHPLGLVPINDTVRALAERRLARVRYDLTNAGPFYPREKVQEALDYWGITY